MELEVLRTTGIPDSSIISIRAGSTRRQAQISALEHPFKFPCKPEECASFKVDILGQIGTARWSFDPAEDTYTLPLEPSGRIPIEALNAGGAMEVAFAIRRMTDDCGAESGESNAWRHRKEIAARDYLEEHNLVNFMQGLLQSLMKEKPDDPYAYLTRRLLTLKDPELAARAVAEAQAVAAEKSGRLMEGGGPRAPTEGVLAGLSVAVDPVSWAPAASSGGFATASRDLAAEISLTTSPARVRPIVAPMTLADVLPTPQGRQAEAAYSPTESPVSADAAAVAKIAAMAKEEMTAEELSSLEKEAASVREKLADENRRLQAAAGELQAQYLELLQERRMLAENDPDRKPDDFDGGRWQEGADGVMEVPAMWISSPNSKASVGLAANTSSGGVNADKAQKDSSKAGRGQAAERQVSAVATASFGVSVLPFAVYYKEYIAPCCDSQFWHSLYSRFGVERIGAPELPQTKCKDNFTSRDDDDTPRTRAWKITYKMQAELDEMAKQNAKLREELHKVREAVQGTHDQIKGMRQNVTAKRPSVS